jgi:excisionase family DNA binding protein
MTRASRQASGTRRLAGTTGEAMQPPKRLWTVPEVATLLQLKESTVRAYAEHGKLPCMRIGNRLRFLPSDISEWIESRRSKGGA